MKCNIKNWFDCQRFSPWTSLLYLQCTSLCFPVYFLQPYLPQRLVPLEKCKFRIRQKIENKIDSSEWNEIIPWKRLITNKRHTRKCFAIFFYITGIIKRFNWLFCDPLFVARHNTRSLNEMEMMNRMRKSNTLHTAYIVTLELQ